MYKLSHIYEEAQYDLYKLLRLYEIIKNLGMGEQHIINLLELTNHNQLQLLQWKVEYLEGEINKLDMEIRNKLSIFINIR